MLRKKLKLNEMAPIPKESDAIVDNKTKSKFFKVDDAQSKDLWRQVYEIECQLYAELLALPYPAAVCAIYNPLDYARELHCQFMAKFLDGPKDLLFVGMNPGPWGCCQTGVPFGTASAVRDWMQLQGDVKKPSQELPTREVVGLTCPREEESGKRFWGVARKLSGSPDQFFKNAFVYNLCPLAFFGGSPRSYKNVTPAEIKGNTKKDLQEICLKHFVAIVQLLKPKIIIAIGRWSEDRVKDLAKQQRIDAAIAIRCLAHPSPRSLNNTDWPQKAEKWFADNDLLPYFQASA